ncbi:MAG: substrate-binding domain-containing protein [Ruthenibacterium sp.]
MADIAHELQISAVSVSKALQNKDGISAALRDKIIQKADELGYRYNISAQNFKVGRTQNIGILISERFKKSHGSFYWDLCDIIGVALQEYHYFSILETVSCTAEQNRELPVLLQSNKVDGLVVLGQLESAYLNRLTAENKPLVLTDFYNDNPLFDTVTTDNFYSSYLITNHLLEQGHRAIGFLGSIHATSSILDRYLGFYKAMLEHRCDINPAWILPDRDADGTLQIDALPFPLPTAFVCNCDHAAYLLIQALHQQNIDVPRMVSVVGFDNDFYATLCVPPLTTVQVDLHALATSSVDYLMTQLSGKRQWVGRKVVPGTLILRDSVQTIQ